jgi:hypothetical protein
MVVLRTVVCVTTNKFYMADTDLESGYISFRGFVYVGLTIIHSIHRKGIVAHSTVTYVFVKK